VYAPVAQPQILVVGWLRSEAWVETGLKWLRRAAVAIIVVLVALGCSKDEPTGHEHEDAAGMRILADGIEATGHLPLNGGGVANHIEFRLLDDHDQVITETDHFQLTLTWDATDLAAAVPVTGSTTSFGVTTSKPADTAGFMTLSVYHPHTQVTKTFGPLHVLVH